MRFIKSLHILKKAKKGGIQLIKEVHRVEIRYIPKTPSLIQACQYSNNVYNQMLYINRQRHSNKESLLPSGELERTLKEQSKEQQEYNNIQYLPAQTVQQISRIQQSEWKSYLRANKEFFKNKSKFKKAPKPPKYKKKGDEYRIILTNQQVRVINNTLVCKIKNKIDSKPFFRDIKLSSQWLNRKLMEVRICPINNNKFYRLELIYKKEIDVPEKETLSKVLGIDLGLNNLCTITSNTTGFTPVLINGKGLKSKNLYFNYKIARLKSIAKKLNNKDITKQIQSLYKKRNNIMKNSMHQISNYIKNICKELNIDTIFIGHNLNQKQKCRIKNFVQIPIFSLISYIRYKVEELGVTLIELNESYTSGTSFLDNEEATKGYYDKSRRTHRGLFVTNTGIRINSDVNGSLQILKRGFETYFKTKISSDTVLQSTSNGL